MESLLTYLLGQWPLAALMVGTFLSLAVSPYGRLWKNDRDRKRVMGRLMDQGWRRSYTRAMRPLLDGIDAALSRDECARGLTPARVAWSHDLILWCLLAAAAYPVLSFIGHWIAGGPLALAGQEIAPPGSAVARGYVVLWLAGPAMIFVVGWVEYRWRLPWFVLATGILMGGAFASERFGVPSEIAGAVASAVAGAVAVAVTVAAAGAATVAGAGAVAVAAGAGAVAGAVAVEHLQDRRGRHAGFWVAFALSLLIALTIAILLSPAARDGAIGPAARYIILFLGVFPLFNALADFASIGLTRHLLRKGLERTTWTKALADFAGGAAIFALLGMALITYIHLVRLPDGSALMNLRALFDGLRDAPGDHWWLFVMLFSTLVPTLLHGMVGLYTLLLHYPAPVRRRVFTKLEAGGKGSDTEGWWGSLGYCAMLTLSIWVPLMGTWVLFTADHGAVLQAVTGAFRLYAETIGAL